MDVDLEPVKNSRELRLTTKGRKTGRPHTVRLWFACSEGRVYLSHEGEFPDWMKNAAKEGRVTARIDQVEFQADARVLKDGPSNQRGKRALYEKYYGKATDAVVDDWFSLSRLVELEPR